jgi:hypothetical protein
MPARTLFDSRRLAGLLAVTMVLLAVLSFLRPPAIVFDSAIGFAVARSMEKGSPFNEWILVDRERISEDRTEFVTMWSPGQYVVPALFETLGFDLGQAMVLTTLLFRISSLGGFYLLFGTAGFSTRVRLLAVAAIAFQPRLLLDFRFYLGGDLLLLGYLPWAILACCKLRELRPGGMAAIVAVFSMGVFLKLSFMIAAAAILVSLFFARCGRARDFGWLGLTVYSLKLAGTGATTFALAWFFFLSRGPATAAEGSGELAWSLAAPLFALSGPVFSLFSMGDFLVGSLEWGGAWLHGNALPQLFLGSFLSMAWLYAIGKANLNAHYKSLAFGFFITYVLAFFYLRVIGSEVSASYRHMIPAGLVLLPTLFHGMENWKREGLRRLCGVAVAALMAAGASAFLLDYLFAHRAVGSHGFAHAYLSAEALSVIDELDRATPPGNNLFLAPLPTVALEIDNRIINESTAFTPLEQLRKNVYRGRVDNLYVILRTTAPEPRRRAVLESFKDYDPGGWTAIPAAEWTVYHQGDFSSLLELGPAAGKTPAASVEGGSNPRRLEFSLLDKGLPYIDPAPPEVPR